MTTRLDLFDPGFVQAPYPWLARLRQEAPVHFDPRTGLWVVSRYRDVRHVLLDTACFRPDNAQTAVTALSLPALRVLAKAGFSLPPALADNSGPNHKALRRLTAGYFSADRVAAAARVTEETAARLLQGIGRNLDRGQPGDLVADYAHILPRLVMMHVLGVRGVDPATLGRWSDDALELFWGRPSPERQVTLAESVAQFHRWLSDRVSAGSVEQDDLIGALSRHLRQDGTPLDPATAVAVCFFVLIAGQSTTGQLIATVLRRALEAPETWARAGRERGFAEAWVEETLRIEPPVTSWRRITACEVELGGVRLPAGSPLLLMLMSAGTDPDVFERPQQMCPRRANVRRHLAFGTGPHRCPGASMARMEAATALRSAARALPRAVAATGDTPVPMLGLLSFRAPLHLPVFSGR
ncbi:cytochrome P450 [Streptomyces sp. HNM0645]|uniref:cytochrome P450 n=1 Tax=Streptomyces sp. HNM0645 TaxID=2782343 RepID=UPI0024B75096|nr:cytochrome P450 [Streptomyces sp. HNM0645]MDI9889485.1 cytochrome P450 [Streptomyces sp. HNM0645]